MKRGTFSSCTVILPVFLGNFALNYSGLGVMTSIFITTVIVMLVAERLCDNHIESIGMGVAQRLCCNNYKMRTNRNVRCREAGMQSTNKKKRYRG